MSKEELEKRKSELLQGMKEYLDSQDDLCVDNIEIMELFPKLLKLQNQKGLIYGRSYIKYGETSIFMNISRKFDRVENIMKKAMENGTKSLHGDGSSTPTETMLDTVVDMGLYSIMWAAYIKEQYPEEYDKFLSINGLK